MEEKTLAVSLREAADSDAPALARLLGELGYPVPVTEIPTRLAAAMAQGRVVVAEYEEDVVGVAVVLRIQFLHRARPTAILGTLVVQANHRGRGVGRALVRAAMQQAAAWNCTTLELTSRDDRIEAHNFYRSLGFDSPSRKFVRPITD